MKEIDPNEIPKHYLYCHHQTCPRRENCLRYQATLAMPQDLLPTYTTVNPFYMAGHEDTCKHHQPFSTLRFASGIDHLLDNIPHKAAVAIRKDIYALMGRSMYYRIRNKERMLHPVEQNQIAAIFKKHRITTMPEFDSYTDRYDW